MAVHSKALQVYHRKCSPDGEIAALRELVSVHEQSVKDLNGMLNKDNKLLEEKEESDQDSEESEESDV